MTPGFWLIVAMAAIILAAFLVWLTDRCADALEALAARRRAQLAADAATFGEPTREEIEDEYR